MDPILEAATVAEEVAATGEIVESVDLTTVSQQLDQIIAWQSGQFLALWVLVGCVIGAFLGKALAGVFR